jgi:transcriptional regulator with XRE-family HTH domain
MSTRSTDRFAPSRVDDAEREHLAQGLGRAARRARIAAGMTQQQLADAAGCGVRTIGRLERGECRHRLSLLAALAAVLSPDDPAALLAALQVAAGPSVAADTSRSLRRRARRTRNAAARTPHDPPTTTGATAA